MKLHIERLLQQYRFLMLALVFVGTSVMAVVPSTAQAAVTVPVSGPNFAGLFTVQRITSQTVNGVNQLAAVGTLTGIMRGNGGGTQNVTVGNVAMPLAITSPACPILHLNLGPVDLNVLGLTVHLNQVVLDLTAVPGAGNLLGNLLCTVANLLNGSPVDLALVAAFLNQILTLL